MNYKRILVSIYKKSHTYLSRGHNMGRYSIIAKFVRKTESILKSDFAVVHGNKMFLDPYDSLSLSINGVYDEFDTKLIKKQVKSGYRVIDLGANIGYHSLLFSNLVGKTGAVYSFEPNPNNVKLLKKSIEVNNIQNITVEQYAASNTYSNCKLYLTDVSSNGTIRFDGAKEIESHKKEPIIIDTLIIDDYFSEIELADKIDFIKINIEGFELRALQGMSKILEENKNLKIFIEFSTKAIREAGSDPQEVLNILETNGFTIYYVDDIKNKLDLADKKLLMTSNTCYKKTINLFCIKESK